MKSVSRSRSGSSEAAQERARAAIVLDRLVIGVDRARRVAREQQVARGALGLVGLGEVARERAVDRLVGLAVERLERLADAPVEAAPRGLEQAAVGHLLHEAVAEAVLRGGPAADLHDQVEPHQLGQRRHDLLARQHALEQRQAEAAPDCARHRDHLARARRQAVEPRLQRALHERRHGDLPVGELPHALAAAQRAALDQVLQRLLEEERVAAGALGEQIGERSRQRRLGQRLGQLAARAGRQRAQLDLADSGAGRALARARRGARRAGRDRRGRSARARAAPPRSAPSRSSSSSSVSESAHCRSSTTMHSGRCSARRRTTSATAANVCCCTDSRLSSRSAASASASSGWPSRRARNG